MPIASGRQEVCIWVRGDALLVANDGKPVTRQGVLALCASDLTEKSEDQSETPDDFPDIPNDKFLAAQRKRVIGVYRADSNRQKRDARHESQVSADYGGRYLWELIQNADDAMAPPETVAASLIGTKGLGFKSVLEVTDTPEVFSDVFGFHFSRAKSAALLQSLGLKGAFAPIFEIPHEAKPSADVAMLRDQGYATVIRLPYRNPEIAALVKSMIDTLDHRFLLFSQNLRSVRIIRADVESRVQVTRQRISDACERVSLTGVGVPANHSTWLRWYEVWDDAAEDKRLSASLCLPVDANGAVQPLDENDKPPLYVFFPTEESLGARAVVHVSFQLEQNRKRFRKHPRNKVVGERLGKLLSALLTEIPAEVSLKAFGATTALRSSTIAGSLAKTVTETLKATAFVPILGGPPVVPAEVVLWRSELAEVLKGKSPGLAEYKLLDPSVRGCDRILGQLGASSLDPWILFLALRFCKNRTFEDCKRVLAVIVEHGLTSVVHYNKKNDVANSIAKIPCWWTERDSARALSGPPLLLQRPKDWPDFVEADALSADMSALVHAHTMELTDKSKESMSDRQIAELWCDSVFSKFLRSDQDYLEHALLPSISAYAAEQWSKAGWDILKWVRQWCPKRSFETIMPLPVLSQNHRYKDPKEQFRFRLADHLRLPTDKGWREPIYCYAGREWGGPREFGTYFREIENRAVVKPLKSWDKRVGQRDKIGEWKSVLRFIGVSWEPKLVRLENWPRQGVERLYRDEHLQNMTRQVFDLKIEHFPDCLGAKTKSTMLVRIGQDVQAAAAKYPAEYRSYRKQSSEKLSDCSNLAEYQLRETPWLPHKGSIFFHEKLVAPTDAYFPGRGIAGLTPEIDIPDSEVRKNPRTEKFLKDLGVRTTLPEDSAPWFDWMKRVADASDNPNIARKDLLHAAKALYRSFLNHKLSSEWRPMDLRVPVYVGGETAKHLQFVAPKMARWLDEPDFDVPAVREKLLLLAEPIFVLFLGQAPEVERRLGIRALSHSITIVAAHGALDLDCANGVVARYRERIRALRALLREPQRAALPDDLVIRAVQGLSKRITTKSDDIIAETPVRAFKDDSGALLIAASHKPWHGVGLGLARYFLDKPEFSDVFETILAAEDSEEVLDRLRQRGIPEQELEYVQKAMADADIVRPWSTTDTRVAAGKPVQGGSPSEGEIDISIDAISVGDLTGAIAKPRETAEPHATEMPSSEIELLGIIPKAPESGGSAGRSGQRTRTRATGSGAPLRPSNQAALLRGKEAEDWFADRLKAAFADWDIRPNERDDRNRETDFVLRKGSSEIHVEVKRLSNVPGDILWSELEFRKAQEHEHRYYVALIVPVAESFRVLWIWNPIHDFGEMKRCVEWTWTGVTRSRPLSARVWTPPEAHETPALSRRYSFRITVSDDLYARLDKDNEKLAVLRRRADAANGNAVVGTSV
ncbi:MAG: DUF3883 domain-containing protein [Alphaproteobacteria bacterium]|nr:DUF3883 domain-containing protein [Alphaproteobacteria bacterium]